MARWLVSICVLLTAHGFAFAQNGDSVVIKRSTTNPKRFDCDIGIATFTTPTGWNANRSGKPTYAILTPEGETQPKMTKMISIDGGKPVVPTSQGMAQAFAKQWKGKVLEETVKLDEEVAYRVTCEPDPKQLKPIDCILVVKDGRVLMLIAGATKSGETDEALNELVASWKWKKSAEAKSESKPR